MLATNLSHPDAETAYRAGLVPPAAFRKSVGATAKQSPSPLAVLAHDLRGPLANLALLIEAMGGDAVRNGDKRIAEQASRAGRIIDRLDGMLTAMLDRGLTSEAVLRPAPNMVDAAELVDTIATLNRPLAAARKVRLHCFIAEPLQVAGDAHLLMQAIDNLLTNAISFTPRRGRVLCEAAPAANGDVLIRITDEGPGLSPAEIALLFRPFSTVPRHAGIARRSTGLGLMIVRQIAEAHGGTVQVESAGPGKGASFLLRLPSARRR